MQRVLFFIMEGYIDYKLRNFILNIILTWCFICAPGLAQISPGVTESVQTSTIIVTRPTSSTPTFTTATTTVAPTLSEIATFGLSVTIVSFSINGQVIDDTNPDLFDSTTDTYAEARNGFVAFVNDAFRNDETVGDDFIGVEFIRFKKGSIIAEFKAKFLKKTEVTDSATKDGLSAVIDVNPNAKISSFLNITLVPNSVTIGDFDECGASSLNNCHADAVCVNSLGSFTCVCKSGTTGNGLSCVENEIDRTVLYIMIGIVALLVFILILFILFTFLQRREARKDIKRSRDYPPFDFDPGELTPQLKGLPRARTIVLPPATPTERNRFHYRNTGWDADY